MHIFNKSTALVLLLANLLALNGYATAATTRSSTEPATSLSSFSEPYCGLYALYAGLKLKGVSVDFQKDLLQPQYLSSMAGSSVDDLMLAAADFGQRPIRGSNLHSADLKACNCPAILHARKTWRENRYDHYVLFAGMNGGRFVVYDTPKTIVCTASELDAMFDGYAILLPGESGAPAVSKLQIQLRDALTIGTLFGMICLTAFGLSSGVSLIRRSAVPSIGAQIVCVFLTAVVAFVLAEQMGFASRSSPAAVANVNEAFAGSWLPVVNDAEVLKFLTNKQALIIDSRISASFQRAHIPTAVNLPVNVSDALLERTMVGSPKSEPIIVYCESSNCQFDEKIAKRLTGAGYEDVRLYRGGWDQWRLNHRVTATP